MNRMMRMLACLTLGMAVAAAWGQSQTGLTVDYTFAGSFKDQGARVDGSTYVTPSLMRRIGWSVDVNNGTLTVLAEGRTFDLSPKVIDGTRLYCFDEALRYVGGVANWDDQNHKLSVLSQIRNVERTDKGFRIDATLAVRTRAFRLSGPDRLVVDLNGAKLDPKFVGELPKNWRVTQNTETVVRVVVESPSMATQAVPDIIEARSVQVELNQAVVTTAPVQAIATVGEPRVGADTKDGVAIVIPVTGQLTKGPTAVFLDPTTIQVSISGSSALKASSKPIEKSQWIDQLDIDDDKQGTSVVTIKLDRPLAFELSKTDFGVSLTLSKPRGGSGLAGKIIVVDAGHGGKDTGASHGGVNEKDMTLAMAKAVAKALTNSGASVIMTRSTDVFISLSERPAVANRSKADLFISCHFNSNSVDDSRSGIIIFHHKNVSMGMLLAECVSHEIGKEHQLPELGVWSDGKIYDSGFAVLRGSTMPAILMELGFLNHSKDRSKIQQEEFREAIARSVVRGVKVFFGDEKKN